MDLFRLLMLEETERTNLVNEMVNWMRMLQGHQEFALAALHQSHSSPHPPRVGRKSSAPRVDLQAASKFSSLNLPPSINPQVGILSQQQRKPVQSINDICRHFAAPLVQSSRGEARPKPPLHSSSGGSGDPASVVSPVSNAISPSASISSPPLPAVVSTSGSTSAVISASAPPLAIPPVVQQPHPPPPPAAAAAMSEIERVGLEFAGVELSEQLEFVAEDETLARQDVQAQEVFERGFIHDDSVALLGVLRALNATRQLASLQSACSPSNSRLSSASFRNNTVEQALAQSAAYQERIASASIRQGSSVRRTLSPPREWGDVAAHPPAALPPKFGGPQSARQHPMARQQQQQQRSVLQLYGGSRTAAASSILTGTGFTSDLNSNFGRDPYGSTTAFTGAGAASRGLIVNMTWPRLSSALNTKPALPTRPGETVRPIRFDMPGSLLPAQNTPRVYPGSRQSEKSRYLFTGGR